MKKKWLLILIPVLVLLISAGFVLYRVITDRAAENAAQASRQETQPQTLAPDFTVYDIDGNPVHLSDYLGTPVVLNFWASWCGPCKMEMPDFQEKYEEYGNQIQFLMVNLTSSSSGETVEGASGFIADQGYTFPVFYDTDSDAAATYGIYSIPTTYFIDADGYALAQATGAIDADILQQGLDLIL